jgi:alkaline phosphatase
VDGDGVAETAVLIQSQAEFQALMTGPTPERVVGVAQAYTTVQQARSGDAMADPYVVARNANVPSLTEMTLGAINVLDNNPKGFVLMVEGGAIDWAAHSNQPGRTIEEQIDFDQAVEAVVNWVETYSNWGETLLIVTGDHETGYLVGPGSDPAWQPLVNNGAGVMPGIQFNYDDHTNSLVRMYAKGDDARWFKNVVVGTDPVRGKYIDNTSIANGIFQLIGK